MGLWLPTAPKPLRPVYTTPTKSPLTAPAAGDSFCSGFTLKYALSKGIREAIYYASANSASVVTKIGAKPGIMRVGEDTNLDPMELEEVQL